MKQVIWSRIGLLMLLVLFLSPLAVAVECDASTSDDILDKYNARSQSNIFFENLGQINEPGVRFYTRVTGGYVVIADTAVSFLSDTMERKSLLVFDDKRSILAAGREQSNQITHFYLGGRGTFTNVRGYSSILLERIFSGADILLSNCEQKLMVDLYTYNDVDQAQVDSFVETLNDVDILLSGSTEKTESTHYRFMLMGNTQSRFQTQQANDPFLSVRIGGTGKDVPHAVARDNSGNLYITGQTESLDLPLVNELYSYRDAVDAFITKMSPTGEIQYSTYIGGDYTSLLATTPNDIGEDIVVDANHNAYVVGTTQSDNFPTLNPMYSVAQNESMLRDGYYNTIGDVFLLKLDEQGLLNFSTYIGGSEGESGSCIALDNSGNVYIGGQTTSRPPPASNYSFPLVHAFDSQTTLQGDGFITCVSSSGDEILFSSYIGGSEHEKVNDIAIDSSGDIVITGITEGTLPLTHPLNSTYGGGWDVFVAKIDSTWSVVYSTYLGGSGDDYGVSVAVDESGAAYITGRTNSLDFPVENAFYNDSLGGDDCFISVISDNGDELLFSSYLGGDATDSGDAIAVNSNDEVFVAGHTYSDSFSGMLGANSGGADAFILKTDLNEISHFSYFGGADDEVVSSMVIDASNNSYICGSTKSSDFQSTTQSGSMGSYDTYDTFLVAVNLLPNQNSGDPGGNGPLGYVPVMVTTAFSAIAIISAASVLFVRRMRREEYEAAMRTTSVSGQSVPNQTRFVESPVSDQIPIEIPDNEPVPMLEPTWNHPTDRPDGVPRPEPQWNHPTDRPDGVPRPEPEWNHPTDRPDGVPRPEPEWNHPTDRPDGVPRPEPEWNHPTDRPDGVSRPEPQWNHPTDRPDGGSEIVGVASLGAAKVHPKGCKCDLCRAKK